MRSGIPLFPEPASTVAGQVDTFYFFMVAVSAFFSLAIAVAVIYFAVRYRREAHPVAEQIEGSLPLEITWSVIPLAIAMVMFVWASWIYFDLQRPPRGSMEIYGIGKQWMWKFQHMGGQSEINQLHVPVGRNVRVTLIAQDVIHSFFVPAFRVKQDVIPGRYTTVWFNATTPGRYHLFCAEYCGTKHSGMIGEVVVMDPAEYQVWLEGGPRLSLAAEGEKLFTDLGCITCHRADSGARGPDLATIYGQPVRLADGRTVTADDAYIRESILSPTSKLVEGFQPIMPSFQGLVSEEDIVSLIAYIRSLQEGAGGEGAIAPGTVSPTGSGQQPPQPGAPGASDVFAPPTGTGTQRELSTPTAGRPARDLPPEQQKQQQPPRQQQQPQQPRNQ